MSFKDFVLGNIPIPSKKEIEANANRGDTEAMIALAGLYYDGCVVPRNCAEAEKWLTKAMKLGSANAASLLGLLYANGDFFPKDMEKAVVFWFNTKNCGIEDKSFTRVKLCS